MVRRAASLVAAFAAIPLFSGGSCTVAIASCTCNACYQVCPCNEFCDRAQSVDFEAVRTLSTYELSVVVEPDGRTTRIHSHIVGVSIERAIGRTEFSADDLSKFASSVIRVNSALFRLATGESWQLDSLDSFETGHVVTYRAGAHRTLTLLFDVRGNLVEIDDAGL
jgi:hypothetical protein